MPLELLTGLRCAWPVSFARSSAMVTTVSVVDFELL